MLAKSGQPCRPFELPQSQYNDIDIYLMVVQRMENIDEKRRRARISDIGQRSDAGCRSSVPKFPILGFCLQPCQV